MPDAGPESPIEKQVDEEPLGDGQTDLHEFDEFIQVEIYVDDGSDDMLVHFLDEDGERMRESLSLQAGEEWEYNFWLNTPPDIQIESQASDTVYSLLAQRI